MLIAIVLLVLMLLGSPSLGWWNHGYGWYPSGGLGLILLIILLVWVLRSTGRF